MAMAWAMLFGWYSNGASISHAEEMQLDVNSPDAIRHALEQQIGKRAKVKLISGQDLEGKVTRVGTHVVVIGELAGLEFYDAIIRTEQIAAVVIKTRTK